MFRFLGFTSSAARTYSRPLGFVRYQSQMPKAEDIFTTEERNDPIFKEISKGVSLAELQDIYDANMAKFGKDPSQKQYIEKMQADFDEIKSLVRRKEAAEQIESGAVEPTLEFLSQVTGTDVKTLEEQLETENLKSYLNENYFEKAKNSLTEEQKEQFAKTLPELQ